MTLCKIFMDTPWCHNIETTKTDGHILIVTSKANVQDARTWIDGNLEPLFTQFLPTNQWFQPHPEYAVPIHTDRIQTTVTTTDYAARLARSIPTNLHAGKDKDKFLKFPTKPNTKYPKYSFNDTQFPKLLNNDANNSSKTTTSTKTNNGNNITQTTKASNKNSPPCTTTMEHATIHNQTQQDLAEKFMNMMQTTMQTTLCNFHHDMQQNFCQSLAKIDHHYYNLSQQVRTLSKQNQHLNQLISNLLFNASIFLLWGRWARINVHYGQVDRHQLAFFLLFLGWSLSWIYPQPLPTHSNNTYTQNQYHTTTATNASQHSTQHTQPIITNYTLDHL